MSPISPNVTPEGAAAPAPTRVLTGRDLPWRRRRRPHPRPLITSFLLLPPSKLPPLLQPPPVLPPLPAPLVSSGSGETAAAQEEGESKDGGGGTGPSIPLTEPLTPSASLLPDPAPDDAELQPSTARPHSAPADRSSRLSKPKWALTATEAAEEEETEIGELLTFVEGLDFGAFIEGMEARAVVQAAPGIVAALMGEQEAAEKEREHQGSSASLFDGPEPASSSPQSSGWGQQHHDAQPQQQRRQQERQQRQQFGGAAGSGGHSMEATRLAQAVLADDEEGASSLWTVHSGAVMKRIDRYISTTGWID